MKLGKIKITHQLILENSKDILPLFAKFLPLHVEREINIGDFIYTGICDEFEDVKEGEDIPFYEVTMKRKEDQTITVEFKKIQP